MPLLILIGTKVWPDRPDGEPTKVPGTSGGTRVLSESMVESTVRRVYRSRDDRVIAGVAGGIGHYLGVDPVLIRISFVALAFAAVGVPMYLIGWLIMPEETGGEDSAPPSKGKSDYSGRIVAGTVLVTLGVLLLLDMFLPIRRVVWPIVLIVIGLSVFAYGTRK
jgi:phage shock protein C